MNDVSLMAPADAAPADFSLPTADDLARVQPPVLSSAPLSAVDAAGTPAGTDAPAEPNGFERLGLAPELVQAVASMGYTQPTAVQNAAIPKALTVDGKYADLMVSSQTGSGKTAAFLLPVLHTLLAMQAQEAADEQAAFEQACAEAAAKGEAAPKRPKRKDPTNPRNFKPAEPGALVVCPTRELAQQVANDAIDLVRHCRGLRIANVVGGMPYQLQVAKLQNANLVVATPGRLLDLQRAGQLKLDGVKFLVMDEADRMLDLGFADDLADINQLTSQRHQTMMFSATFAPRIQQLALRVMHDGGANVKRIQIDTPQEKHANITQSLYWADNPQHKRQLLDHWLRDTAINQAIVFASTQIECDDLANDLQQAGFSAVALHGALSQAVRNRRLMALRDGRVQILVATDVAARGIDVPTITHVFNYGLPMKAEDYTHRIGRTGRAGRDGLAITFAEFRDRRKIADIEMHTQQPLKAQVVEGLEPKQRAPQTFVPRGADDRGGRGGRFAGGRGAPMRDGGRSGGFGGGFSGFGRSDSGRFDRNGGSGDRGGFDRPARPDARGDARGPARAPWAADARAAAPRPDFRGPSDRFDPRGGDRMPHRAGAGHHAHAAGAPAPRGEPHRHAGAPRFEPRGDARFAEPRDSFKPRHAAGPDRSGFEAPRRRTTPTR